jgi:hypothetical protein
VQLHITSRDLAFQTELWIVNDLHSRFEQCTLRVEITDGRGRMLVSKSYPIREIAPDSSASYERLQWKIQGEIGETFRVAASLRSADGKVVSSNRQVLLIADQEQARKQCQERAKQLRGIKSQFPTADYYRFFPELSGPERSNTFGCEPPRAEMPQ